MFRKLLVACVILASSFTAKAETLTIYTYDGFASDWGAGPPIAAGFEEFCNCEIEWRAGGDAVFLFSLLKAEGNNTQADVILGLDTNLMAEAVENGMVAPHSTTAKYNLPINWDNSYFVPYDYGYFAVMVDTELLSKPPQSLDNLIQGDFADQLIIQDPRTSSPGMGFLYWMHSVYGDDMATAWQQLQPNILTVTPGWSEAYGLFLEGRAPLVLSYTTSQSYHEIFDETYRYQALIFPEGHQIQIETAAISAHSDKKQLAQRFLDYLVSDDAQTIIPTTNIMYPVVDIGDDLPQSFQGLPVPVTTFLLDSARAGQVRNELIDIWLENTVE